MTVKLESCPAPETLTDFLLGNLPASEIESYQLHLTDCEPCGDTIRGLKVDDTFSNLTREAFLFQNESQPAQTESQVVERLIAEMQNFNGDGAATSENQSTRSLEGRSAEVQQLLQAPAEEGDLGLLGHYRLLDVLGAGSTGVVYRAVDQRLQRAVALKILRPSLGDAARERFVAEARATAAIEHPNVVTIYEVGTEGPLAFIAMQWLAGETLEEKLESSETLPVEKVQQLAIQIAEGLAAAHQQNLIHRDIKPANIWIPQDNSGAKILDFGLVRIADEDPQLTCTGMIAGTPCYMSPEQSRGQKLDGRSDLFSLGCLMYQSLAGRLPFRSDNALATLQSIQRDQPTPLDELDPSIPSDVSDLVMCLLDKTPNRRPPTASAVVKALRSERRDWTFDVASPLVQKTNSRSAAKSTGWWKALAALLACLAFGFGGIMFGDQITRIVSNEGVIEIETNISGVKIDVVETVSGKVVTVDTGAGKIDVKAGEYSIRPSSDNDQDSITIENNNLTVSRGGKAVVVIKRKDKAEQIVLEKSGVERKSGNDATSEMFRLEAEKDRLLTQYGNSHPSVKAVEDRIKKMKERVKGTTKRPYTLDTGDTLGVYIGGVLGEYDGVPPVQIPPAGSGLPPAMGFPIQVDERGEISVPMIEPVQVRGKTVRAVKEVLLKAYTDGEKPILTRDGAKIFVSMVQPRDYVAPAINDKATGATASLPAASVLTGSLQIHEGDVLGIFIEGVLGQYEADPPIYHPPASTGLPPVLGFPIPVGEGGKLSLPMIPEIDVDGKTLSQIKDAIKKAYMGGKEPILNEGDRIFVGLIHKTRSEFEDDAKKGTDEPAEKAEASKGQKDVRVTSGIVLGDGTLIIDSGHRSPAQIEMLLKKMRKDQSSKPAAKPDLFEGKKLDLPIQPSASD